MLLKLGPDKRLIRSRQDKEKVVCDREYSGPSLNKKACLSLSKKEKSNPEWLDFQMWADN